MHSRLKDSSPNPAQPIWEDFSQLKNSLASYLPRTIYDNHSIGPFGEIVPFEVKRKEEWETNLFGTETMSIGYVRVGNIIFLDHRLKSSLKPQVQQKFKENIIWLWNFASEFAGYTHLPYAQLCIYALTTLNLKDSHVLDLGAGDGVMGLVAHKMGSAKISSVELYPAYETLYRDHLAVNDFGNESFDFISEDIGNREALLSRLEDQKIDVVVANIGPTYEDVHLKAIKLLGSLPSVKTYIAGAYIKSPGFYMDSSEAINELAKLGFRKNFREFIYNTYLQAFVVDRE